MSTTRLSFLYPHLHRGGLRLSESTTAQTAKSRCRQPVPALLPRSRHVAASITTTATVRKYPKFERHGKAVEPLPGPSTLPEEKKLPQPEGATAADANIKALPAADQSQIGKDVTPNDKADQSSSKPAESLESSAAEKASEEDQGTETIEVPPPEDAASQGTATASSQGSPTATPAQAAAEEKMETSGPLDAILHMPPPEETPHPHIQTPPYVHHFDSYTLVKQLEGAGYSQDQSITVMKAVRRLLASNLDIAQDGLVSKSDVENETYLFKAACSELGSEVKNNRRKSDEDMRQQRTHLQHEVDVISQRMSQEILTLRDEVKGMFNDRKMAVREEQRASETAVQQLHFEIGVVLNSDAKSDIESLRWILIQRAALGILFMAIMTFGTLRYATYVSRERQREEERVKQEAEEKRNNGGREDHTAAQEAAQILAAN